MFSPAACVRSHDSARGIKKGRFQQTWVLGKILNSTEKIFIVKYWQIIVLRICRDWLQKYHSIISLYRSKWYAIILNVLRDRRLHNIDIHCNNKKSQIRYTERKCFVIPLILYLTRLAIKFSVQSETDHAPPDIRLWKHKLCSVASYNFTIDVIQIVRDYQLCPRRKDKSISTKMRLWGLKWGSHCVFTLKI